MLLFNLLLRQYLNESDPKYEYMTMDLISVYKIYYFIMFLTLFCYSMTIY